MERRSALDLEDVKEQVSPVRRLLNSAVGKLRKVSLLQSPLLFRGKRLTEWKAYLVKSDVPLKNVRKLEITLASCYLPSSLSHLDRFREPAGFCIRSGERPEVRRTGTTGKLDCLGCEI